MADTKIIDLPSISTPVQSTDILPIVRGTTDYQVNASDIVAATPASTLTGTTLASNVVSSSLTSVGTIGSGTWAGGFGSVSGANLTNLTPANIAAGTAGIDISGNAATVTTINARITAGSNVSITGSGTAASPYSIAATGDVAKGVANVYTKTQNFGLTTLTDAATISWDLSSNQVCQVTLGGNRIMGAPSNIANGASYTLFIIQDGTGNRTITSWDATFKFTDDIAPVLSTAPNRVDIIGFVARNGFLYGSSKIGYTS